MHAPFPRGIDLQRQATPAAYGRTTRAAGARPPLRHLTRLDDRIGETQFDGALGGEKRVLGGE